VAKDRNGSATGDSDRLGFGKPTIYWDADLQKELIIGRSIQKYRGGRAASQMRASARLTLAAPAGRSSLVEKTGSHKSAMRWPIPAYRFVPVDLLGDWREELLEFTDKGELRIHLSTIPAVDRRACLMQDPIYRRDIAMCAMAYHRPAMLSYCPAASTDIGNHRLSAIDEGANRITPTTASQHRNPNKFTLLREREGRTRQRPGRASVRSEPKFSRHPDRPWPVPRARLTEFGGRGINL